MTSKSCIVNYFPTPEDLAKAMVYLFSKEGMTLRQEDLRDTVLQVMQFFGFEREVVGNPLHPLLVFLGRRSLVPSNVVTSALAFLILAELMLVVCAGIGIEGLHLAHISLGRSS